MSKRIEIGSADAIARRRGKAFDVGEKRIAVFRTARDEWFALDDACPHLNHSLAGGWIDGNCVNCPGHGAMFDLRNGEIIAPPASESVESYSVIEENGKLYLTEH
ncbi:MAG: Rieske 2Fe-2S domain-containing protein [Verrucomicrobiota bacterium]